MEEVRCDLGKQSIPEGPICQDYSINEHAIYSKKENQFNLLGVLVCANF